MAAVIPGDEVPNYEKYGPGIDSDRALVAGILQEQKNALLLNNNFKHYIPAKKDHVIGIVTQKGVDRLRVSLQNFTAPVYLDSLAFENATRRNRPNLQKGDVVYAQVISAERDTEAEIVCKDLQTGKSAGFGQLKEGNILNVSVGFARHLLFKGHPVLEELGAIYAYELAIGVNGRIWVKGSDIKATLLISQRNMDENRIFRRSSYA